MRGLGIVLMALGGASFVMPKLGYQFKLISIFGEYQLHAAIGAIVVGAVLFFLSLKGKKKDKK